MWERARWNAKVREVWDRVSFVPLAGDAIGPVSSGKSISVSAAVEMAGLAPEDVRVEAVMGRIGTTGCLEETEVLMLPPVEQRGSVTVFAKEVTPRHTGRLGYAVRVSPNHYEDPLTRPVTSLIKWGS